MEVSRVWHSNESAQRVAGQVALAKVQASRTLDTWVEGLGCKLQSLLLGLRVRGFGLRVCCKRPGGSDTADCSDSSVISSIRHPT